MESYGHSEYRRIKTTDSPLWIRHSIVRVVEYLQHVKKDGYNTSTLLDFIKIPGYRHAPNINLYLFRPEADPAQKQLQTAYHEGVAFTHRGAWVLIRENGCPLYS